MWHKDSELNNDLLEELKNGLSQSKYFDIKKNKSSLTMLKEKEIFLGEHIGEGVFVIDMDNKITFYNEMFKKMLFIEKQNLFGIKLEKLIPIDNDFNLLEKWGKKIYNPISSTIETKILGLKKFYNITFSPIIESGRITNVCGIIRDITLQKKLETDIKISNLRSLVMNKKLISIQKATIFGFSKLSEYKDRETGAHLERIQNYVKILAYELYKNLIFIKFNTKKTIYLKII